MSDLDKSESGLGINIRNEVFTPQGTPSPPGAASTVARPPPRPRRFPTINYLHDNLQGMMEHLSMVSQKQSVFI
jgi:hypothetical protein